MIIQCPSCHSEFFVKADLLGERGRKVRCNVCKFSWFQKLDKKDDFIQEESTLSLASNKLTPEYGRKRRKAYKTKKISARIILWLFIVFILCGMGAYLFSPQSVLIGIETYLSRVYDYIDVKNTPIDKALEKENIQIVEGNFEGDFIPMVTGRIKNVSDYPRVLPPITLIFYDKVGCFLDSCEIDKMTMNISNSDKPLEIKANATYDFRRPLTRPISKRAKGVVIKFDVIAECNR